MRGACVAAYAAYAGVMHGMLSVRDLTWQRVAEGDVAVLGVARRVMVMCGAAVGMRVWCGLLVMR